MGYKILGFAVWNGGKWYVKRRYGGGAGRRATAAIAGVVARWRWPARWPQRRRTAAAGRRLAGQRRATFGGESVRAGTVAPRLDVPAPSESGNVVDPDVLADAARAARGGRARTRAGAAPLRGRAPAGRGARPSATRSRARSRAGARGADRGTSQREHAEQQLALRRPRRARRGPRPARGASSPSCGCGWSRPRPSWPSGRRARPRRGAPLSRPRSPRRAASGRRAGAEVERGAARRAASGASLRSARCATSRALRRAGAGSPTAARRTPAAARIAAERTAFAAPDRGRRAPVARPAPAARRSGDGALRPPCVRARRARRPSARWRQRERRARGAAELQQQRDERHDQPGRRSLDHARSSRLRTRRSPAARALSPVTEWTRAWRAVRRRSCWPCAHGRRAGPGAQRLRSATAPRPRARTAPRPGAPS